MTDPQSKTLVEQIQQHFANMGWQPLLTVKVNGLMALTPEKLRTLVPKILAAQDRMGAVTVIVEALIPEFPDSKEKPDLSDSAILRLRPDNAT